MQVSPQTVWGSHEITSNLIATYRKTHPTEQSQDKAFNLSTNKRVIDKMVCTPGKTLNLSASARLND